eukprot:1156239-Pelagomonas_calceolata.AAC.2
MYTARSHPYHACPLPPEAVPYVEGRALRSAAGCPGRVGRSLCPEHGHACWKVRGSLCLDVSSVNAFQTGRHVRG